MKPIGTLLGTILGMALLAATVGGIYVLLKYVGNAFGSLEPQAETLAAIASVVALLCAVIIAQGLKARGRGGAEVSDRARLYGQLLAGCCERLAGEGRHAPIPAALEQSLALHGNHKVVAAYVGLRRMIEADDRAGGIAATGRLLAEMRADLGHAVPLRDAAEVLAMLLDPRGDDGARPASGGGA